MTWLLPDRPEDSANTKVLKHGYRTGVKLGSINPDEPKARELWMKLDGGRFPTKKEG